MAEISGTFLEKAIPPQPCVLDHSTGPQKKQNKTKQAENNPPLFFGNFSVSCESTVSILPPTDLILEVCIG